MFDGKRACVLGEYGGIGLALNNHLWEQDRTGDMFSTKRRKRLPMLISIWQKNLKSLFQHVIQLLFIRKPLMWKVK
jgi:hypothetical protein